MKNFKVCVDVSSEEEYKTETDIIESHFKKALRALGDVVIVDETGDWQFRYQINIHVIKDENSTKTSILAIASSLENRIPKHYFKHHEAIGPEYPVCSTGPSATWCLIDNLPAWCVLQVSTFEKTVLTRIRELPVTELQRFLYYP